MKRLALMGMLVSSMALVACGVEGVEDANTVPQTFRVSTCGGFAAGKQSNPSFSGDYCAAEVLDWTYDAKAGKLMLTDNRALLNCCGDHSVKVTKNNGTYVITETDAPEQGNQRCQCMCVFDFEVSIEQLNGGVIPVELVRNVTDNTSGPKTLFSGTLDLSKGSGVKILSNKDAGTWCETKGPSSNAPAQSYQVSACGGFAAGEKSSKDYAASYCDAEVLKWSFDAKTGELALKDNRVLLNCCGDHSVKVTKQGAGYLITETDAPEQGGGRCLCMCVFDFAVVNTSLKAGLIPITLVRNVTDDTTGPKTVFTGTLDLSKGVGAEVLSKKDVSPWCTK